MNQIEALHGERVAYPNFDETLSLIFLTRVHTLPFWKNTTKRETTTTVLENVLAYANPRSREKDNSQGRGNNEIIGFSKQYSSNCIHPHENFLN